MLARHTSLSMSSTILFLVADWSSHLPDLFVLAACVLVSSTNLSLDSDWSCHLPASLVLAACMPVPSTILFLVADWSRSESESTLCHTHICLVVCRAHVPGVCVLCLCLLGCLCRDHVCSLLCAVLMCLFLWNLCCWNFLS